MKHIKEEYGSPCNIIESTNEEFFILKNFLKEYGIEARRISACGNTCQWQIRNGYKDWVHLNSENKLAQTIISIVEDNIKNNTYAR